MKKILLGSALACVLSAPFGAYAEGAYVEVGAGRSNFKFDDGGLTSVSKDEQGNAYKLAVGAKFDDTWGIEAGYADLGKASYVYKVGAGNVTLDTKSHALYVAGTATADISDDFALFAKLGVTSNHSSASASASISGTSGSAAASGNKSSLMGGFGALYNFSEKCGATLSYDYFDKVAEDSKGGMWSLGVRVKF